MLSKKICESSRFILPLLFLSLGSFYLAVKIGGYTFVPVNGLLDIFLTSIMVCLTVAGAKNRGKGKVSSTVSPILPLFAGFFVIARNLATGTIELNILACTSITIVCTIILFFSHKQRKVERIIGTLYSLLVAAVFFLFVASTLSVLGDDFVEFKVLDSKMSPNATYLAEVIDADAGATGGATRVEVTRQNSDINLLIGTLKKNSKAIYIGRWGESLVLHWETDEVLCINGREHVIGRLR